MLEQEMCQMTSSNALRHLEYRMKRLRESLLEELANLQDDGIGRFRSCVEMASAPMSKKRTRPRSPRKAPGFPYEQDAFLINCRDELRKAWLGSVEEKQQFVDDLLYHSVQKYGIAVFIAPITVGRLTANAQHFLSQLAVAVLENWQDFAKCANPECAAPYFLRPRRSHRYCGRDACSTYAKQKYALDYWHGTGHKRRSQKRRSRNRRRRSKAQ